MKIAVSVPDELFARADDAASRLGLSRSQVYARALEEFLESHGAAEDPVTARINELADAQEPAGGAAAHRFRTVGMVKRGELWWADLGEPVSIAATWTPESAPCHPNACERSIPACGSRCVCDRCVRDRCVLTAAS